jgi:hypothetical protein
MVSGAKTPRSFANAAGAPRLNITPSSSKSRSSRCEQNWYSNKVGTKQDKGKYENFLHTKSLSMAHDYCALLVYHSGKGVTYDYDLCSG